jgi:hypothetical protein
LVIWSMYLYFIYFYLFILKNEFKFKYLNNQTIY